MQEHLVEDIIIGEIRELRQEVRDMRLEVFGLTRSAEARLAACEGNIKPLIDNGRPGMVSLLRDDVTSLQKWKWYVAGLCVGVSAVSSLIFKLAGFFVK